jgi:YYY domain-containing protein
MPVVGGFFGIIGGWWQWAVHDRALPPFDWWRSSRVHFGQFDITEFPYFSLLFGDLHPHLMDVPYFGLVIALGVSYVVTVRTEAAHARGWLLAALTGLAAGLIRTVHTWDFPTAVLIGFGAIVAGQALRRGRWQDRWWLGVGHVVVAGLALVVFFAPYTAHFETFDPGLIRAPQTTKVHQYFVQYGVFVALAVLFIAVRYHEELAVRGRDHGRNPFLASVNGWMEVGALAVFAAGLGAFTYTFGLATIAIACLLEVYLLNLLWLEWRAVDRDAPRMLATGMFALAFAISAGVDVVTLKNDIVRMNTVFKFGIQAWQLFALGSAFAACYCGQALWDVRGAVPRPGRGRRLAAVTATLVVGFLVSSSAIYLWSGTRARQEARFADLEPTLNGMAFLPAAYYREDLGTSTNPRIVAVHLSDDEPLIEWLRNNVRGSPVIAEAVGPLYHWTGRMSEYTGLPAVIGWDWHQIQQRTDYQPLIDRRRADTASLYTSPSVDLANQYLRKYDVSYVIVGTEEVLRGTDEGRAKFDTMPALSRVLTSGEYRIYRVDQSKLGPTGQ